MKTIRKHPPHGWKPSRRGVIGGLVAAAANAARGQTLTSPGPVGSLVIPFPAGSLADLSARRFASLLGEATGGTYVVENTPGGAGIIAARQVLRRPPDGRTLLWANSALICNTPLLANPPLDFDPTNDFLPVCTISRTPYVLIAGKGFPAGNLDELQKVGKARTEPLTFCGFELGSANQIAGEVLFQRLGIRGGGFIPYRNSQQSMLDVAEGRVQLGVVGWNSAASLMKSGALKGLAVLSDKPLAAAPELATIMAQGWGGFDIHGWFALLVARKTPEAIVLELEKHMQAFLGSRDFQALCTETGQEAAFRNHANTRSFIASEIERYRITLRALKLA